MTVTDYQEEEPEDEVPAEGDSAELGTIENPVTENTEN